MEKFKFKIKDKDWDIIFDDPKKYKDTDIDFTEDDAGATVYLDETIYINSTLKPGSIYAALKHELTHAHIWTYGFYYIGKWDEENVCAFSETYMEDILELAKKLFSQYTATSGSNMNSNIKEEKVAWIE